MFNAPVVESLNVFARELEVCVCVCFHLSVNVFLLFLSLCRIYTTASRANPLRSPRTTGTT